jgi:RimJ/RimL family protein N-acetyltransferase
VWSPWSIALEPVRREDAGRVRRSLTAEIASWLGIGSVEEMRAGTAVWATESESLARSHQAYRYVVLRDAAFAGVIEVRPDAVRGHVGYWLRRVARGRGTASMANRLVLPIAFEGFGLKAVDWTSDPRNAASIAVFERLGARRVGEFAVSGVAGRTAEVRYRLARRGYHPSPDGPPSLRALLTCI